MPSQVNQLRKSFNIFELVILTLYAIYTLFPLYITITGSLKSNEDLYKSPLSLPMHTQLQNYPNSWVEGNIGTYFFNSILVTVTSVLIISLLGCLAAFSLSRKEFKFSKVLYALFIVGMIVPMQAYMVPLYVQVSHLGLLDSYLGLILCYVAVHISFSTFILVGFFRTIPEEITKAAEIDGCNELSLFWKIYVPLARPAIATVIIFTVVQVWNDVLLPLLFIRSNSLYTVPVGLLAFNGEYQSNYSLLFAGVIISAIPIILLYVLLQRVFVQGITAGAVKG